MSGSEPQQRSVRRRHRRRAERAVDHQYAIDYLRQQLQRCPEGSDLECGSGSSTSGNISSSDEGENEANEDAINEGNVCEEMNDNEENVYEEMNDNEENVYEEMHDNEENVHEEINVNGGDDPGSEPSDEDHGSPIESESEDDVANMTSEEKEAYLCQSLQEWASSGGVLSMRKIDELLQKLSYVFSSVPKSYKTLLGTTENAPIEVMDDHCMWYKGIKANLDQMDLEDYIREQQCIKISINMDGLPLHKNVNSKKFWPILGKLDGSDDPPFVIAIYFGTSDPRDVDTFLGDFIIEVDDLNVNGYESNGAAVPVEITNFILDAPARSMVKCCIGHSGYCACEKCSVVGEHSAGRINFANVPADCVLRTDQSYSDQIDRLHHTGRSPLELINIKMVSSFRLDTMHLVYKGVCLRLLDAIFNWQGPWNPNAIALQEISDRLLSFIETCPRDFNRKPRKIEDYYKYKATELRRFLLYDGIVALKDKLPVEIYQLFLLLHCAIYILSSPYHLQLWADDAEGFINAFVQYSAQIFGQHFVVYNVHSLTHLVEECRHHGTLESFSAFPFENQLKTIKQTLRTGYKPLEQIVRRDSERKQKRKVTLKNQVNNVQLFQPYQDGYGPQLGNKFKRISVNGVTLKLGIRDSCFMTRDGIVVVLNDIIERNGNEIFLGGKRFNESDSAYTYPLHSATLGILKVSELSEHTDSVTYLYLFLVLKFQEKNEEGEIEENLEIGCRKWIEMDDDFNITCWWPPKISGVKQLHGIVAKNIAPEPDEGWTQHPCEILSSYATVLDAHIGLKNRIDNSDYATEKEMGRGHRKRLKRQLSSDEEEHPPQLKQKPVATLPSPPKIKQASAKGPFSCQVPSAVKTVQIVSKAATNENRTSLKLSRSNRGTQAKNFDEFKQMLSKKKKAGQVKNKAEENEIKKAEENEIKKVKDNEIKKVKENEIMKVKENEIKKVKENEIKKVKENEIKKVKENEIKIVKENEIKKTYESYDLDHNLVDEDMLMLDDNEDQNFVDEDMLMQDGNESQELDSSIIEAESLPSDNVSSKQFGNYNCSGKSSRNVPSSSPKNIHCNSSKETPHNSPNSVNGSNFERKVLVALHELGQKIDIVSANQTKLQFHLNPSEKVISRPEGMPTTPLKTTEALDAMEKCLEKHPDYISILSHILTCYVSRDPKEEEASAKQVMHNLLGNSVGKLYSLRGKHDNLRFDILNVWKAVKGAILLKFETDLKPTEAGVKLWFRDAYRRNQEDGSQANVTKKSGGRGGKKNS
ncbi:hypothetical protein FOCC_FOCC008639 [Frankliniella occidentalis]|nr:hypothetical protein FOCC_FOCC008639 [Frankliniella occidentalis]